MITLLLFLSFVFSLLKVANANRRDRFLFVISSIDFGVLFFISFLSIIGNRVQIKGDIAGYEATRETIAVARQNKNISEMELATLQTQIISINRAIASYKKLNESFLDEYIPDEIIKLEMLK